MASCRASTSRRSRTRSGSSSATASTLPEDVDSACAMRATVHEVPVESDDADAVGCAIESCENHHERVAQALRRRAARHSGNVTGDRPGS
ncbi:hypothetical protein G9C85_11515 [Halorubellus sp. JP-L1]|uniref:hypothetical protein n=1 Tax=Halorubellus sp. JP-L1 TaxID=2715753 RepID=UPI00140D26D1|nr:hypothetical protein [Halorubellus sp. JP-L1]NHN42248.1 hypothetical protein [Halorubellus sp. JP-L1]